MEKIKFKDEIIEYNLERKRIKNCYISIKDGIVNVRVPLRTSDKKIKELIEKRAEWIIKNVKKQKKTSNRHKKYENGEIFGVLGKEVILNINYENIKKPKIKFWLSKFIVSLPNSMKENKEETVLTVKNLIDNFYTELAEKEIEKAMRKVVMNVGIAPNSYKVKNLKSTWGNCSTSGNISISRNIVMYSRRAIEYVCLHEVCHLENMNHSKRFWVEVEKYMPDYKKAEEELKK